MANHIFQIENLHCQYKTSKQPVLEIKKLNLPKGEVIFFVGSSGVGKSTLLETLGLMNNTIQRNGSTIFTFFDSSGAVDVASLWDKGEKSLASFRRSNLSFIFQSTNLFHNLTAFENVCLSQIVQGKERERAELDAKRMLKKMFEKDVVQEILEGKKVTELSGGQRQRLAFVRAAVTDYSVLLADEPTGNLDWANAKNLIHQLVESVRDSSKTAVIVTHDIALALEYGDRVVLIRKIIDASDQERVFGLVDNESVYVRNEEEWIDHLNNRISSEELTDFLKKQLK